jgi:hypothetical protein
MSPHWIRFSRLAPNLFTKFPRNQSGLVAGPGALPLPDLSLIFPFFLILGYKNSRPMFPLSFRLVLASHYFCVDRSKLLVHFLSIQHASIKDFHCIAPFCCHFKFFSSYCFTVARVPFETVSVISYVHLRPFHGYSSHNFTIPSQGGPSGLGHASPIPSQREGTSSTLPDLNFSPPPSPPPSPVAGPT